MSLGFHEALEIVYVSKFSSKNRVDHLTWTLHIGLRVYVCLTLIKRLSSEHRDIIGTGFFLGCFFFFFFWGGYALRRSERYWTGLAFNRHYSIWWNEQRKCTLRRLRTGSWHWPPNEALQDLVAQKSKPPTPTEKHKQRERRDSVNIAVHLKMTAYWGCKEPTHKSV